MLLLRVDIYLVGAEAGAAPVRLPNPFEQITPLMTARQQAYGKADAPPEGTMRARPIARSHLTRLNLRPHGADESADLHRASN